MNTVAQVLNAARDRLETLDARVLLAHVLGRDATFLIAHPEYELDRAQLQRWGEMQAQRLAGVPVAYLTGEREFYGRSFLVSPAVLIPRPDTELLVDAALAAIPSGRAARVLDLGTGSGCIAVTIAAERPRCQVTATDVSVEALAVALRNAERHQVPVEFVHSDWFSALPEGRYDLIVSNPPYIAPDDPHLQQGDLPAEPGGALIGGGMDGMAAIRAILGQCDRWLPPGGRLLLEHGYDQGLACRQAFAQAGFREVATRRDLGGCERVTGGVWRVD